MKALCCETIHQFSSRSFPSNLILFSAEHHLALSDCMCVSVCTLLFVSAQKKLKMSTIQKDRQLLLLLLFTVPRTHTHTHTHHSSSVPQCFPAPPNHHCPAVPSGQS
ncbi:hypothetical protein JOB18_040831 [Solea senegalensis]|uniref:Uncharacterized protein n=1 Tax=Solea senegalensis TaxID=28829 RepID=A0AAV6QXM9_SOLSE|nr:hypothetical protein JOB18_040831 [Solea senegalensis]